MKSTEKKVVTSKKGMTIIPKRAAKDTPARNIINISVVNIFKKL